MSNENCTHKKKEKIMLATRRIVTVLTLALALIACTVAVQAGEPINILFLDQPEQL
jgi:hypothetical protein